MRRVSKVFAVSVVVVCLTVPASFAGLNGNPRQNAPKKKPNPIVELLHRLTSRVFDGGDMSVPKP
jgi:hypothetical protein